MALLFGQANGKKKDWKINGKELWSVEYWEELDEASHHMKYQLHMSAHRKDDKRETQYNDEVPRRIAGNIPVITMNRQKQIDQQTKRQEIRKN